MPYGYTSNQSICNHYLYSWILYTIPEYLTGKEEASRGGRFTRGKSGVLSWLMGFRTCLRRSLKGTDISPFRGSESRYEGEEEQIGRQCPGEGERDPQCRCVSCSSLR